MYYLPLVLLLFIPILGALLFLNVVTLSFAKLGLNPTGAFVLVMLSIVGSVVHIPVYRERVWVAGRADVVSPFFPFMIFRRPPRVEHRVIAVNLGGAVIPTLFSLYLLTKVPFFPTLVAVAAVTLVTHRLARFIPGRGIGLPIFIPPLAAALVALLVGGAHSAPIAYISGVLGTLIGADLLNMRKIRQMGGRVASIGGAGVWDAVFLVGIVAALLG